MAASNVRVVRIGCSANRGWAVVVIWEECGSRPLDRKRVTLFHFAAVGPELPSVEEGLRRVIGDGASTPDREVEGLEPEDLLALHRSLVRLRTYDERSLVYHRQGRIGTYAVFWGHEAVQAGAVHALGREDWIFPTYRESAIGILRGMPVSTVLSWWRGHPAGWWNPAEWRVASICVPIATQVPHAAGLAWGLRLKGEDGVALVFFGDGATSEGAFHEGANIAAVTKAPLVLLCNNNQWAISTPLSAQTAAATLADKAVGYGMPAIRVDGTDVLAVLGAVREAAERARAGAGPTFVEAVTYRAAPHATADDPSAYVDPARVKAALADECLGRFEAYLRRRGLLDEALAEQVRSDALDAMRQGIAAAEEESPGDVSLLFEHVYASPPAAFARDQAELRQVLAS
jgi:pyruvate dehydrogenase E1 component alpha subunit